MPWNKSSQRLSGDTEWCKWAMSTATIPPFAWPTAPSEKAVWKRFDRPFVKQTTRELPTPGVEWIGGEDLALQAAMEALRFVKALWNKPGESGRLKNAGIVFSSFRGRASSSCPEAPQPSGDRTQLSRPYRRGGGGVAGLPYGF